MTWRRGRWPRVATLVAIALFAVWQPVTLLTVRTEDGDTPVCRRMAPGGEVTLVFIHSMYGGEVRETWRIDGSELVRTRVVTEVAAAAEYYASDGRVERVADGFEVVVPPLREDALPVRVDSIGQHRLRVGEGEVSLAEMVDSSERVILRARQVPVIVWLIGGGCG